MIEEETLLALLKEDPSRGIQLAINQYGGPVKTICRSILAGYSIQDVEETISDTFVGLWKSRDKIILRDGLGIKGYLYGIARTTALNRKRSLTRKDTPQSLDDAIDLPSPDNVEETAIRHSEYQLLYQLIDAMKQPDREIFIYRYYYQLSVAEVAHALKLTPKAVEGRLSRGKGRLRRQLLHRGIDIAERRA